MLVFGQEAVAAVGVVLAVAGNFQLPEEELPGRVCDQLCRRKLSEQGRFVRRQFDWQGKPPGATPVGDADHRDVHGAAKFAPDVARHPELQLIFPRDDRTDHRGVEPLRMVVKLLPVAEIVEARP